MDISSVMSDKTDNIVINHGRDKSGPYRKRDVLIKGCWKCLQSSASQLGNLLARFRTTYVLLPSLIRYVWGYAKATHTAHIDTIGSLIFSAVSQRRRSISPVRSRSLPFSGF